MGSSSGKRQAKTSRNKERANMSFFIVVMFFAVFGIIVFTEIFLIDERGRGAGVVVRHGSLGSRHRSSDRADYEDILQARHFCLLLFILCGVICFKKFSISLILLLSNSIKYD